MFAITRPSETCSLFAIQFLFIIIFTCLDLIFCLLSLYLYETCRLCVIVGFQRFFSFRLISVAWTLPDCDCVLFVTY